MLESIQPPKPRSELLRRAVESFQYEPGDVTPEQYTSRLAACETCPFLKRGKCVISMCSVTIRAKSPGNRCPHYVDHWAGILDAG
jgi:hypothetical protein